MSHTDDTAAQDQQILNAHEERQRRWRLILGKPDEEAADSSPSQEGDAMPGEGESELSEQDQRLDRVLESLYGDSKEGDLSDSNPDIARWLGDVREYFPSSVAQIMQHDAIKKVKLRRLLAQPDFLEQIEPDVGLVANILSLGKVLPSKTRETAKEVVRKVVAELIQQLEMPLRQAISGTLNRAVRSRRPRYKEINWQRTIHKNLRHYQVEQRTVIPETLVGYGRKRSSLRDVILCVDTSGSMAKSVVYSGIYASVMASIPALTTRLVMFDTSVVDLTDELQQDPVDLLFGIRLGGGTNIGKALTYCQQLITRPADTTLILISDLFEGNKKELMLRTTAGLAAGGIQMMVLLALDDQGAPRFDRAIAAELAEMGVPSFACTPDQFPGLMSTILNGRDITTWTSTNAIVTAPDN